jgi:hypothetical protein
MTNGSPLWPNPAPRGPITLIQRVTGAAVAASTTFLVAGTDITFIVPDGEPLTDILNRAYALGHLAAVHGFYEGAMLTLTKSFTIARPTPE